MDKLDSEIEAKRKAYAEAQRLAEMLGIELRALEQAARLRPVSPKGVPEGHVRVLEHSRPLMRGRQAGSLTKKWRAALADLAKPGNPFRSLDDVVEVVVRRTKIAHTSARERLRLYAAKGVLEEQDGTYRVSDATLEKYRLRVGKEKAPVVETEASHLNGAEASG